MDDRWLPGRAALYGFAVGLIVFMTLHLTLDLGWLGFAALSAASGLVTAAVIRHMRKTELLRTSQAQGYFTSAMIVSALLLVLLPRGYVVDALRPAPQPASANEAVAPHPWSEIYPDASAAVLKIVERAKLDYPLADLSIQTIVVSAPSVMVVVFDPTGDVLRAYSMDRDGTVYAPSVSNVDPTAIHEFALSSLKVNQLNTLYWDLGTENKMLMSGHDDIFISAPADGQPPEIALGYGKAPNDRRWIYTDAAGVVLRGPTE